MTEVENKDLYGAEFFHMTPLENLPRIQREGLIPRSGETSRLLGISEYQRRIYLALFPEDLMDYPIGREAVILRIKRLPKGAVLHLDPDAPSTAYYYITCKVSPGLITVYKRA